VAIRLTAASSQYLGRTASVPNWSAYVVMFEVYLDSDTNDNQAFCVLNSSLGAAEYDMIGTDTDGVTLKLSCEAGSTTGAALSVGQWYKVAIVRASATDLRMYVDGAQAGSTITASVSGRLSCTEMRFGSWFGSYQFLDGRVEDIKILESAPGADEIADRLSVVQSIGDEWAWIPAVDDTLASSLLDYSGNGRDLTGYATPTIADGSPTAWGADPLLVIEATAAETMPILGGTVTMSSDAPVVPADVATVTLSVLTQALEVGTTGGASAVVKDSDGNALSGRTVTWVSSNTTPIASPASGVTGADGRVSVSLPALAAGTTTLTATCETVNSAGISIVVSAVAAAPGYSTTGSARIVINCVSVIKRMGRATPRRFSDADQRKRDPTDTAFSRVKDGAEKSIVSPNRELLKRLN
jgi:hypothetical protein